MASKRDLQSSAHPEVHAVGASSCGEVHPRAASSPMALASAASASCRRARLASGGCWLGSSCSIPASATSSKRRASTTATQWERFNEGQCPVCNRQTSSQASTASVERPTSSEPNTSAVTARRSRPGPSPSPLPPEGGANCRAKTGSRTLASRKLRPSRPLKATDREAPQAARAAGRSPKRRAACNTSLPSDVANRSQPFQADMSRAQASSSPSPSMPS
mmetsp:Transcript_57612/g.160503  ORF Transcript_57612/g.160503 Transcript_57612/m.160503 type:complete len:219 (+) Transcript_57612:322-978(+)